MAFPWPLGLWLSTRRAGKGNEGNLTAGSGRKELMLLKIGKDALKNIKIYEVLTRNTVYFV